MSCTVSVPWLVMRTVYSKIHSPCSGREFSGECRDRTSTRMKFVTASDIGACSERRSGMVHANDSRAVAHALMRIYGGADPRSAADAPVGCLGLDGVEFIGARRVQGDPRGPGVRPTISTLSGARNFVRPT